MDILNNLQYFLKTETPFMLMFALLFMYFLKTARDREVSQEKNVSKKVDAIQEQLDVMMKVWKILLEKELEARKK
jgi:flagellin-specific chaperone FliS